MKPKFSSGIFLNITSLDRKKWREDIRFIKFLKGVQHVEVWLEEIEINLSDLKFLKKELKKYRIIVHAPFINLSLVSSHQDINETTVEILKKTINKAYFLGSKITTIHAGGYPLFMNKQEVKNIFIKNYSKILNYAKKKKIEIDLENISKNKTTQISYPVKLAEMNSIKKLIPEIKFTLDVGHCIQNNDNSFLSFIKKNFNRINNIHIHNAETDKQAHFGLNYKGDFNWRPFLDNLVKIGYDGFLTVEILEKDEIKKSWNLLQTKLEEYKK